MKVSVLVSGHTEVRGWAFLDHTFTKGPVAIPAAVSALVTPGT